MEDEILDNVIQKIALKLENFDFNNGIINIRYN
jgi:hypothetical protein